MYDFVGMAKEFFGAVGAYFGWAGKRSDLNNTPEVKTAVGAQKEVDAITKEQNDIKKDDPDAIGRDISS